MAFAAFDAPHHDIFYFPLNLQPFLLPQILGQLPHRPHAFLDVSFLVVLLHTVVGEVDESVVDVIQRELVSTKSDIAFIVKPNFGWVEILDEDPLPNIKLLALNDEWMLDILLHNELYIAAKTIVGNII